MAGRSRHIAAPQSPAESRRRIDRAVQEGRFQQALELTKRLHADEPTPEHRQLLIEVYFGRARQLRAEGRTRDASLVLDNLPALLGDDPAGRARLAEELAACGASGQALKLLEDAPESPCRGRVLAQVADQAVAKGQAEQALLPENLRAGHAAILRAFEQAHAGQDDAVRETLQAIGLQSPFLEWKLLLRGLLAYYQNDDARALENWSRLNVDRLPARLAAPLRAILDPAYRMGQPPETQAALQRQADKLAGVGPLPQLRAIQAALATEDGIDRALKLASTLVPALQQQEPKLVVRLAAACYAAIIQNGVPDDIKPYRRVFRPPPDDAEFYRLEALACERHHDLAMAHENWGHYEKWVADHPPVWGEDTIRVRALIWARRGDLAADMPDDKLFEDMPDFLRSHPGRPKPLDPPAEACFHQALALAPDLLDAHEAYVEHARHRRPPEEFSAAARSLLERFPDHVATLHGLGDHCAKQGAWDEALLLYERALHVQPLERALRAAVSLAHARVARGHMEAKRFAEARQHYSAALAFHEGKIPFLIQTQWAISEFLAKQPEQAEQLLKQAQTSAGHTLPVAFAAAAEAIRGKLPAKFKARFAAEFSAGLESTPEIQAAVSALEIAGAYRGGAITYRGQKPHEQQLLAYLKRIQAADIPEPLLIRLCIAMQVMKDAKLLRGFTTQGARRFPNNPQFPVMEAESYLSANPKRPPNPRRIMALLDRAQRLAEKLPADAPERDRMLEVIGRHQQVLEAAGLLSNPNLMMSMLESMMGGMDDDDDDDF